MSERIHSLAVAGYLKKDEPPPADAQRVYAVHADAGYGDGSWVDGVFSTLEGAKAHVAQKGNRTIIEAVLDYPEACDEYRPERTRVRADVVGATVASCFVLIEGERFVVHGPASDAVTYDRDEDGKISNVKWAL